MEKEQLLDAWIDASMLFKANRFLNEASLNEMLILKELIRNKDVNARDLCKNMNILKSQMSHLIDGLEIKGYIERFRNEKDERKISLRITKLGKDIYEKEHKVVLKIMSNIEDKLGKTKTKELCELLHEATSAIKGKNND